MSFTITAAVNCLQSTKGDRIHFHKICSVAFRLGKGRDKAFLLRGVTFAHTIPGGYMASTTAVRYH